MRGETERRCLDIVKRDINDNMFFATSIEDEDIIMYALTNAIENPHLSEFPDFIFDKGCIEHFQVTSSATTRKGATIEREKAEIGTEFKRKTLEVTSNLPSDEIVMHTVETDPYWHKTHSYENFVVSFKSNFEKHIESLKKHQNDYDNVIFLIEYTDSALSMSKKYPSDLMLEVMYGDLLSRENPTYRLSRDTELLRYINEMSKYVHYVVFVSENSFHGTSIDVVNSRNALEIIKLLGEGYDFHCAMIGSSQFGIGVSIPNKESDINNG